MNTLEARVGTKLRCVCKPACGSHPKIEDPLSKFNVDQQDCANDACLLWIYYQFMKFNICAFPIDFSV